MTVTDEMARAARKAYQDAIPEMFHADGGESDAPIRAAITAALAALKTERDELGQRAARIADTLEATLAALVAERDEARERANAAIEDYNDALAALATANARVERLDAENTKLREYYEANEDVFRVGQLNATLKQFSRREDARAALKGDEDDN